MLKYRSAFERIDKDRFEDYLVDVCAGEKKIHADTLFPYEVLRPFFSGGYWSTADPSGMDTLEQLWEHLREALCEAAEKFVHARLLEGEFLRNDLLGKLDEMQSHIKATRDALDGSEGIGRKLDFIAQEMNRESNTILSKSDDLEVSDRAIELKTTVEKVREQIQNIE